MKLLIFHFIKLQTFIIKQTHLSKAPWNLKATPNQLTYIQNTALATLT